MRLSRVESVRMGEGNLELGDALMKLFGIGEDESDL
jgi:hypothetical protein